MNVIRNVGGDLWVGGRFRLAGAVLSPNLAKWNLSSSQWQGLGGTVFHYDGTSLSGFGLDAQTIMVTAIDPGGAAVGVALNGTTCAFCPVTPMASEAFYTVENGGAILRGQGRTVQYAGIRAVVNDLEGHDQITAAFSTVAWETWLGNRGGLGQLGVGRWQLPGYGGPALPPLNSPYWPAFGTLESGWKPIGTVNAIVSYNGETFVGGSFDILSGAYPADPPQRIADFSPFKNIVKWSGAGWSKLENAAGIPCVVPGALGVNGTIHALDVDSSLCTGQLNGVWVGGTFSSAGGGSAWNLAFWNVNSGGYWDVPATPTITSPPNGGVIVPPASIQVSASFAATGCTIAGVAFYEGNRLLAADTVAPYAFTWSGAAAGSHSITAVATVGNGRLGVSDTISFRVDAAPTVTLTSPQNGAVFTAPANITLTATASDNDGTITKVEFYKNGTLLGSDTTAPFSYVWNSVATGSYTLTARATDNDGAVTVSDGVSISVQ